MSDVKDCSECAVSGRRDFIVDALRGAAVVIAALGLAPMGAEAMPALVSALSSSATVKTYPVPAADGVQIDKDAEVILARSGKQVYAFALSCPHQNTALKWEAADNRFQCPKHKSRYRPDGTFIEGRATRGMDRYAVKLVGGNIVVDVDKLFQEDMDRTAWLQAAVTL
jgi:nitrite reductase/ring-hydroxylating ferredoxin subunit